MREKFLIAILILAAGMAVFHPPVSAQDAAGKAQQLIAQARKAMGVDNLKSLGVEGSYRRSMGQMEMNGELTLEMILPDKMLKVETMRPFGDLEINRLEALNGDAVWEDQQQSGGGGANIMIRRGGAGGDPKKAREMMQQNVRAEFARLALGLLVASPAGFPVEYSFAGEAESPDGKADVLDVKGPNNFAARLFLDRKSHHPLMLTYKGKKPRAVMHTSTGGPPSEQELEKRMKDAETETAKSPDVEFQVRFSDYKSVGGVTLPHRISKGIESETSEEIEFTRFKINPQIKPEKFTKK